MEREHSQLSSGTESRPGSQPPIAAMSGVGGLDDILAGGFVRNRLYLIEGHPGTGKTTLAIQFLMVGAAAGEKVLYVTLSETEEELRATAAVHGWDLDGIEIFELVPPESLLDANQQQSLLYSSDLELGETTTQLFLAIERTRPSRIVLDSLSELRLLAQGSLRYRRQVLTPKHYVAGQQGTVLMLDDLSADQKDYTLHSVAHGVIRLEELAPDYGAERRRLRVVKYRGRHYRGGFHDFAIRTGGLVVFPRLVSAEFRTGMVRTLVGTGITELDMLLGGGVERGTSTLIIGPTGTGKSLLSLFFVRAAVQRGERAAMFVFDEEIGLLFDRASALGIDLRALQESGGLLIEQVDAAELSPGEFSARVRDAALAGATTVVIDSINGYQAAMPEEKFLVLHMHELLQYLSRLGANTFLTVTQHGLVGDMQSPVDVTYLADTVVLLRYFEAEGRVRRAISIIKKRAGPHEQTIREFQISSAGLRIGAPLHEFQGVLRGIPTYVGERQPLFSGPYGVTLAAPDGSERVLILAPIGRDATVASAILGEAGIAAAPCLALPDVVQGLLAGAGAALLTEEAIATADLRDLVAWVAEQPPWSDFPFVLLIRHGTGVESNPAAMRWMEALRNVALVERPFHPVVLVSVLRAAIGSRRRQYQARALIETQLLTSQALRENEENLRFALAAARLGAWTLSMPDRVLDPSDQFKRIFGRTAGDRLDYTDVQTSVVPSARALVQAAIERAEREGEAYEIEFPIVWPDGSEHWVASHARVMPGGDRTASRLVGLSSDITARRRKDAELDRHRERLADLVAERTRELETANLQLKEQAAERERSEDRLRQAQKMEAVGQLTGGIAHDFNNLLSAIMGSLELINNRTEDPRILRLAGNALTAVNRGARLTRQLLAFSRTQRLDLAPVRLNALIEAMQPLLASSLGATIVLDFALDPAVGACMADANQLELAILNLAINSRDAMAEGGTLTIATSVPPQPDMLAVAVSDTGPGMQPDVRDRAFEPFFTTKPVGRGTGLGLSQVYGIARQSGGTAAIDSAPGCGTTVTILLPRTEGREAPIEADADATWQRTTPAGRRRDVVLVIDDDADVRKFLVESLRTLGYGVAEAPHGAAGLERMAREPKPDLIIVDFAMPGMNGAEVAAEARRRRPGLPIVLATGYAETAALRGELSLMPILRKPFHMAELATTIHGALKRT